MIKIKKEKYRKGKKKYSILLLHYLALLVTLFQIVQPVMAQVVTQIPESCTLTYHGKTTYGGSSVGNFEISGNQAYCLQHSKTTPSNGTVLTTSICNNENVIKALYYGWRGKEQWEGFKSKEQGIVITSLALSHYYNGDRIRSIAQDFIDFLNTKSVPDKKVSFSKSNISAYIEGEKQRTETIELSSKTTEGSIEITLPSDITYVNESNGTMQTGGVVTIYGQTRFHLEAPQNVNLGTWSTGQKSQGIEYKAIVGKPANSSLQDVGYISTVQSMIETSLTVQWLQLGKLKLTKIDNKGARVKNTNIKFSYNADMSNPIGTYQTGEDGSIVVENLKIGKIYYQEVSTPNNLILDTTIKEANIEAGKMLEVTLTNNWKQAYIQVIKKDKKTGNVVKQAGAEFEIVKNDTIIETITTNVEGIAKSGKLDYGEYIVREKKAPQNYIVTNITEKANLQENEQIYSIEFYNEAVLGKINIKKVDSKTGSKPQGEATLEGAIYELYAKDPILAPEDGKIIYNANEKVGMFVTNNEGKASIDNLYLGEYYIKEIEPSKGYTLDSMQYNVSLTYENQTVQIITKNITVQEKVISQAFEIIKISAEEDNAEAQILKGVEFTIKSKKEVQQYGSWEKAPIAKNANGQEAEVLVTNEKGYAISQRLPYGTYIVRETKVPNNKYKVPDFEITISEDKNEPQTWKILNDASFKAVLTIMKQDEETQKTVKISGAKFKIKNTQTGKYFGYWSWSPLPHYIDTWETTEEGMVMTQEQLPAGKYQLEEIESPYGYLISKEPINFEISSNVAYQTLPDGQTPNITVIKQNKSVKGKIKIKKQGEMLKDFNNEKFTYEKVGLSNAIYKISAKEDIMDSSKDGSILYKKGSIVDTVTTNEKGEAITRELPLGKYVIKEIQAPIGFVRNKKETEILLEYQNQEIAIVQREVSFINERQKIELNVVKKDIENNIPLQGAKFGLYAKENIYNGSQQTIVKAGNLIKTAISNKEGKVNFEIDLPLGTYEIKELEAPKGYATCHDIKIVNASYQGQEIEKIKFEHEFKNKIIEIQVSKKDITDSTEIEGAHLIIFEKGNEKNIIDEWISGKDGKNQNGTIKPHTIKGLEVGKVYTIKEIESPYGFAIAKEVEFKIEDTNKIQKVEMYDEIITGKLEWAKIGETFMEISKQNSEFGEICTPIWKKANLSQTEITIYAKEDIKIGNNTYYKKDEKVQTLSSNKKAVKSIELPVGKYYYIETKVPYGYIENKEKHYFEIKNNQKEELQIVSSMLENSRAKVKINLTKVLEKQETFPNEQAYRDVQFGIFARKDIKNYIGNIAIKKDSLIAICKIDENGHLKGIPDLPNGYYYIKELKTNSQYILDSKKQYDFEISYHGESVSEYEIEIGNEGIIKNKLARGNVKIIKQDTLNKNKKLENVEFYISTNKNMEKIIAKEKTNKDGIAMFKDLELGTYYIQEAKQIDGYVINDTVYKVQIKENQETITIEVCNKPVEMEFLKVDETGTNALAGATLQIIESETGNIVEEWISTTEKHKQLYLVEGKEYILKEVTAPYGYEMAKQIKFIAEDGKTITMQNNLAKLENPKTGDERNLTIFTILFISSSTILISIVIYKFYEKCRKKE